jgi:hypothetical protein
MSALAGAAGSGRKLGRQKKTVSHSVFIDHRSCFWGAIMLCPRCGSEIPPDDMNLANLVAQCRQCNEVFSFADQV